MKRIGIVGVSIILVLLFLACAPQAAPAPVPKALAPAAPPPAAAPAPAKPAAPAVPAKPAWEVEWERVVAAAKQEGMLTFGTTAGSAARSALSEAFKNKYEIRVESVTGYAATLVAKILAERRAGLYLWDVIVGARGSQLTVLKPAGGSSPLEPAFILPDLTDPEVIKKVWYDGKLPWLDRDRRVIGALLYPEKHIGINTNLVKPGEIKSFDDLLEAKWKGKIALMDPSQPGSISDASMMPMLYEVKGESWVRKLAAQEPGIVSDMRVGMDWLARGKYPIFIPPNPPQLVEFLTAGAPIMGVSTEDIMALTAGVTTLGLVDKAPHPNAAKVFINWYLSKEGLTIMSKTLLAQSGRLDVPTDFLPPDAIRQPGWKYWFGDREEVIVSIPAYRNKSKEIFGHLVK